MAFNRDDDVKVTAIETLFQGFFRMVRYHLSHRLYGGGWSPVITREVFERGHAAVMLPYDPVRDELVMQEQFRVGALATSERPWLKELVAGIIDEGETAEQVVRREAMEEAGLEVGRVEKLFSYLVSPGGTTERIDLFIGEVDASNAGGIHGLASEAEDIRVEVVSRQQALALLAAGTIDNAATLIGLQWLQVNGEALRARWLAER